MAQRTEADRVEAGPGGQELLAALDTVLSARREAAPDSSYVASLYDKGLNKILEKVGEEATELILAARDNENGEASEALVAEVADLWFHSLVLLHYQNLSSADVTALLQKRFGLSGLAEKAARTQS